MNVNHTTSINKNISVAILDMTMKDSEGPCRRPTTTLGQWALNVVKTQEAKEEYIRRILRNSFRKYSSYSIEVFILETARAVVEGLEACEQLNKSMEGKVTAKPKVWRDPNGSDLFHDSCFAAGESKQGYQPVKLDELDEDDACKACNGVFLSGLEPKDDPDDDPDDDDDDDLDEETAK